MEYMQLSMDDYIQSKNEIKQELGGIVKSFVRIGWQLTRINKSEAYKHDGYHTITEFAKAEYGMNPSGVSRFMNVYEKYSLPGDTPELQDQYKDFKFAQLAEMLQLSEEDRQIFRAEDKREDIRNLKEFNKENANNPMNLLDWKTAQSTEDKLKATIQEFFHEKDGLLDSLYSSEAYRIQNIKEMSQIINPGDSMSYRKGTVFLMFHQEDITMKIFNGDMTDISWEQFFTYTKEIFAEAEAGDKTYEKYFGISEEIPAPVQEEISEPVHERPEPAAEDSVHKESEIAPAQKPEEGKDDFPDVENEETDAQPEVEPQIPGQDNIINHPEYMPKPAEEPVAESHQLPEERITDAGETSSEESVIALAQSETESAEEESMTRKEYIDTLTAYGTAEYIAKAMGTFSNKTYNTLLNTDFWNEWLNGKVDHNGRVWEE